MKITVIGATGEVGARVVALLKAAGHDVVGAARSTGTDVLSGQGLDEALDGTDVLVDVTNSPSFDGAAVMAFFTIESSNVVAAAKAAGVRHYVALSIVGVDGLPDSGYMRAKVVQENTISASGLPYTIVRATQFHEFTDMIIGSLLVEGMLHVPDARIQPIAAAEVAKEVADAAQGVPIDGIINIGGPEKMSFLTLARDVADARGRHRTPIVVDPAARYFGAPVDQDSLVTGPGAAIAGTKLRDWLSAQRTTKLAQP